MATEGIVSRVLHKVAQGLLYERLVCRQQSISDLFSSNFNLVNHSEDSEAYELYYGLVNYYLTSFLSNSS